MKVGRVIEQSATQMRNVQNVLRVLRSKSKYRAEGRATLSKPREGRLSVVSLPQRQRASLPSSLSFTEFGSNRRLSALDLGQSDLYGTRIA
jgi:hypothetical protein